MVTGEWGSEGYSTRSASNVARMRRSAYPARCENCGVRGAYFGEYKAY